MSRKNVALNQLINAAEPEKLFALQTQDYFRERAAEASIKKAKNVLKRIGKGNPPLPGDQK